MSFNWNFCYIVVNFQVEWWISLSCPSLTSMYQRYSYFHAFAYSISPWTSQISVSSISSPSTKSLIFHDVYHTVFWDSFSGDFQFKCVSFLTFCNTQFLHVMGYLNLACFLLCLTCPDSLINSVRLMLLINLMNIKNSVFWSDIHVHACTATSVIFKLVLRLILIKVFICNFGSYTQIFAFV